MASMTRPRSEIGGLQYRDILFEYQDNAVAAHIIFFREPKETRIRTFQLGTLVDASLYSIRTLHQFITRSTPLRQKFILDHSLFLAFIEYPKKVRPTSTSTVASWISKTLIKASVDPRYKPHSLRSASSTKAVEKGVSMKKVKQHAKWSEKSNTFEKYYLKPTQQSNESTKIANTIFSFPTENRTTLKSDSQSTRIVEGTCPNNNTSVDEEEDENVVITRP